MYSIVGSFRTPYYGISVVVLDDLGVHIILPWSEFIWVLDFLKQITPLRAYSKFIYLSKFLHRLGVVYFYCFQGLIVGPWARDLLKLFQRWINYTWTYFITDVFLLDLKGYVIGLLDFKWWKIKSKKLRNFWKNIKKI